MPASPRPSGSPVREDTDAAALPIQTASPYLFSRAGVIMLREPVVSWDETRGRAGSTRPRGVSDAYQVTRETICTTRADVPMKLVASQAVALVLVVANGLKLTQLNALSISKRTSARTRP